MEQYHLNLIGILKRILADNDISIISETDGFFELTRTSLPVRIITAQYVPSMSVNKYFHGSSNNTEIDTIARFEVPEFEKKSPPSFYIFPIHNTKRGKLNFAVIPSQIVIERIYLRHQNDLIKRPLEVTFWLMPDDCLYDCTNVSAEGEWFFLSKGANGRIADDTDWNYTPFLNNWQLLVNI